MSELSDQLGSETEAPYSPGADDSETEYARNFDYDDREYESNSDDFVL